VSEVLVPPFAEFPVFGLVVPYTPETKNTAHLQLLLQETCRTDDRVDTYF